MMSMEPAEREHLMSIVQPLIICCCNHQLLPQRAHLQVMASTSSLRVPISHRRGTLEQSCRCNADV